MKIVIIGTGNVASQLGLAFLKTKHKVVAVYGKTSEKASLLGAKLNASFGYRLENITTSADVYIIAVSDDVISEVVKKLSVKNNLVVHTSGSAAISVFKNKFTNYGVFYPLQTISKNIKADFKTSPFCIEASNVESQKKLMLLAKSISNEVYVVNSEQRNILHLTAVFVNNFTNHLFSIAQHILSENNLSFDLLKPLINETVRKIKNNDPDNIQTFPAKRKDEKTIRNHINLLKNYPDYRKIYKELSKSIMKKRI